MLKIFTGVVVGVFVGAFVCEVLARRHPELFTRIHESARRAADTIDRVGAPRKARARA